MSLAPSDDHDAHSSADASDTSYPCDWCGDLMCHVNRSFCSDECSFAARGDNILNQIDREREVCSTCFCLNRDLHPIPDSVCKAGTALQYANKNTAIGIDVKVGHDVYQTLEYTRFSCQCGAVDTNAPIERLQDHFYTQAVVNLYPALIYLHEKGAIDHQPCREAYLAAIESNHRDIAYVAGRTVYDSNDATGNRNGSGGRGEWGGGGGGGGESR